VNLRLFVAIDLPESVTDALERLCTGVPGARWTDPQQYHLTLRFVGEVDGLVARDLDAGLAEISFEPFTLHLDGFGHFPPRGAPKVLWSGISPREPVDALRRAVDRAVLAAGVEPERRKFSPHVTVARFPGGAPLNRIQQFLAGHALYRSEPFRVDRFHLYSSQLHADGAIHTLEATYGVGDEDQGDDLWGI
jgi:2'-5' RNA ligase